MIHLVEEAQGMALSNLFFFPMRANKHAGQLCLENCMDRLCCSPCRADVLAWVNRALKAYELTLFNGLGGGGRTVDSRLEILLGRQLCRKPEKDCTEFRFKNKATLAKAVAAPRLVE